MVKTSPRRSAAARRSRSDRGDRRAARRGVGAAAAAAPSRPASSRPRRTARPSDDRRAAPATAAGAAPSVRPLRRRRADDERVGTGQGSVTLAGRRHPPHRGLPRPDRRQRHRREDRRAVGRRRAPRGTRRPRAISAPVTVLPGQTGSRRRRHRDARAHSRPRAGRAAVLRHGVHRRSPRSPRTSATCAPPAATSSSTTSATSSRRRSRTARARRRLADQRRRRHPGGEGRDGGRRAVFLVGRQRGQSQRRHVGRVGRRLRSTAAPTGGAAAGAGTLHRFTGAQDFNTADARRIGPDQSVLVRSARRLGQRLRPVPAEHRRARRSRRARPTSRTATTIRTSR